MLRDGSERRMEELTRGLMSESKSFGLNHWGNDGTGVCRLLGHCSQESQVWLTSRDAGPVTSGW